MIAIAVLVALSLLGVPLELRILRWIEARGVWRSPFDAVFVYLVGMFVISLTGLFVTLLVTDDAWAIFVPGGIWGACFIYWQWKAASRAWDE